MARKGYDITTFLPLFAGRYMGSADVTADVVYDLNGLYCNLMTENYYQYFTELCKKNGLRSFIEPYGIGPINTLDVAGHADLPISEFWMNREMSYLPGTISGARIYGKNVISAESFTSFPDVNWKMHPAMAKTTGDEAWARGINDFMFHRFTHQANTHAKPGLTMSRWGSHFDRTQTWWMNAGKAWFEYIARGSYMLRQGYAVADVLVFVGDGSHNDFIVREKLSQSIPEGINYDCTNADVLINRIALKNKKMVLPEGNLYSYLLLENIDIIKMPTLRRLKEIADAGVLWITPFETDITNYLKKGENRLEIRVTNQWSNRLIGDERYPKQDGGYALTSNPPAIDSKMPQWYINNQPMPEGPRTTFCSGGFYSKGDPLMPSGLMGPVFLKPVKRIEL
jgi:hypothetical protein